VVAGNPARVIRRWDPEAREWRPPAGVEVADSEAVALAAMRERMAHLEARLSNGERRRAELVRELADATRRREAAEHWLAELERSPSWRATEPLRQLKRAAGRRGRRT
jgi:chromosome segregation ATPase